MKLVDSSGWIEYFTGGTGAGAFAGAIEDLERLVVPTVCLTEVFKFIARATDESAAVRAVALMQRGIVVELDASLSLFAARMGTEHSLPLADSIVYATGLATGALILTQDADFAGLAHVEFSAKG